MKVSVDIKSRDEVFTHKDDDGTVRTFLVGAMNRFVDKYPMIPKIAQPITSRLIDIIQRRAGIEEERVERLVEPYISRPILTILWPDGEGTIVDGNHRIIKRSRLRYSGFETFLFSPEIWKQFLTSHHPVTAHFKASDDFMSRRSGIIEAEKGKK